MEMMEPTLEARVQKFSEKYLSDTSKPFQLNEVGEAHLKSLLDDAGYSRLAKTPIYQRSSGDNKTIKIQLFENSNVIEKGPGFSYIELKSLNELDDYLLKREARLRGFSDRTAPLFYGILYGGISGGLLDLMGMGIAGNSEIWNPSAWWLAVPPLVIGGSIWAGSYLNDKKEDKEVQKGIDLFLETYKDKITTGKEALLKALSYQQREK